MNNDADSSNVPLISRRIAANFWESFLKDEELAGCNNLEKLLAGCEVIAALDHIDELLAA